MIKPNYSPFHTWLLDVYIGYILKTDFREIIITGDIKHDERSVLIIPNHFSWWDGFFIWSLNKKLFRKRYHVMMLEHELSTRKFFARVGAFSVNLKSKGIIESLDYCSEILKNPNNMLLMFPQGKLESQHQCRIKFRRGVERIIKQSPNARVILATCLTDFFGYRKPTLTIALSEYKGEPNLVELEQAFNDHLVQSTANQTNIFKA